MEKEMSNETDLDWLARNVHVWPKIGFFQGLDRPEGWRWVEVIELDSRAVALAKYEDGKYTTEITEQQWLARRAELQNKPSWKDAPEWAQWLAQDSDGGWWFYRNEPTLDSPVWRGVDRYFSKSGDTIGDWRDTLEKRPSELHVCKGEVVCRDKVIECNVTYEVSGNRVLLHGIDMSEQAVTARLQEATDNVLAAVPELKSDKYKFDPFISIEYNQEQDMTQQQEMQQDNGWFERGELPPVGRVCQFFSGGYDNDWFDWCIFHGLASCGGFIVEHHHRTSPEMVTVALLDSALTKFRPIRTERDDLIEIIASNLSGTTGQVADAIIAAGFKLEAK